MFCSAAARAVVAAAAANNSLDLAERVRLSHLHLSLSVTFDVMLNRMIALFMPVTSVVLVVLAFSVPFFFFLAVLRRGKQLLWQSWYDVVASFEAASKDEEAADTPLTSLIKVYDIFKSNHPLRFRKWSRYEKKLKECKLHENFVDMLFLEMELRAEFRSTPLLRLVQRTWEEAAFDRMEERFEEAAEDPDGADALSLMGEEEDDRAAVPEGFNDGFPDGFDDALSPMEEGEDNVDVIEGDEVAVCTEPSNIFCLRIPSFSVVATPKPSILRATGRQQQQENAPENHVVFSRQHSTLDFVEDDTVDQLTFRQVIRSETKVPAYKLRKKSILLHQRGERQVNNNRVVFHEHALVHPFNQDLPVKQRGETDRVLLCPEVSPRRLRRSSRVRKQPDRYTPSF